MSNFSLKSVAMLVETNFSVWTARKLDRKQSADVVTVTGATNKGAARVNKNLLAGRTELEDVGRLVTEIRNYVMLNTLPWSDNGQRLLIGARFVKFNNTMEDYKESFEDKVASFVNIYPTLITAQAMALGAMFDRAEFPPASEIAHKFNMGFVYLPVPAAGDLRVDIGNQAQDEIRAKLETLANARVSKAVQDMQDKFVAHLQRMAARLTDTTDAKTGEPVVSRLHETLVSSAFELCDLVYDYGVLADSKLVQARQDLEKALADVTINTLRDNPDKRKEINTAVSSILNKFSL